MKNILNFQSEQEFQNFFSQLASAEIDSFRAIEGSGGDMGFDGISDQTAYQVYYPSLKNRTDANFIKKINIDLEKIIESIKKLNIEIKKWIFVVPEDLRIKVVLHLNKKTKETGIECKYWGYTKIIELITKYPHIQDSFPNIFLPPVRKGLKNLEEKIAYGYKPRVLNGSVEIIGDNEYEMRRKNIIQEHHQKAVSAIGQYGDSSASIATSVAYQRAANQKLAELKFKKEKSDKAFQLDLADIDDYFDSEKNRINEEMNKRGLFHSGIRLRALGELEIKRKRFIERLKLKYGKK